MKQKRSISGYSVYSSVLNPRITRDQYNSLRTYANEKGISLSDFKDYTGDISEIIEIIDKIARVSKDFPLLTNNKKQVVLSLHFNDSEEFAGTENHTITLNGIFYNNSNELKFNYALKVNEKHFVQNTTYKDIIYHELGHVVCNLYNIDPLEVAKRVTGIQLNTKIAAYVIDNLSRYSAITYESIERNKGNIFDGSEIIAECFCAYYSGSGNAFANDYVKEILKEVSI